MASARSNSNLEQLGWVLNALRKAHPEAHGEASAPHAPPLDPLSHLILAVLSDGASDSRARSAFKRLQEAFVDWNEMRVTPPDEVAEMLRGLPAARDKAAAMNTFLNAIFESRNVLTLDFLTEKPKREARSYLEGLAGVPAAAAAVVTLVCLEGHAVPADTGTLRLLTRLRLVEPEAKPEEVQPILERHIASKDALAFHRLVRLHAEETCLAADPKCGACVLSAKCPSSEAGPRRGGAKAVKAAVVKPPPEKPAAAKPAALKPAGAKPAAAKPAALKPVAAKSAGSSAKPAAPAKTPAKAGAKPAKPPAKPGVAMKVRPKPAAKPVARPARSGAKPPAKAGVKTGTRTVAKAVAKAGGKAAPAAVAKPVRPAKAVVKKVALRKGGPAKFKAR